MKRCWSDPPPCNASRCLQGIAEFHGQPVADFVYYSRKNHPAEVSSGRSGLRLNREELLTRTRMKMLKRSAVALMAGGILLVLIFYLHPSQSQQPAEPPKPHKITINW